MRKSVKIAFSIIGLILLLLVGFLCYIFFIDNSLYGKGKIIDFNSNPVVELNGMKLSIKQAGYFEGEILELKEGILIPEEVYEGQTLEKDIDKKDIKENSAYVIMDVEIENNSEYINTIGDIHLSTEKDELSSFLQKLTVKGDNKNISEELLNKYHLFLSGLEVEPGKKLRGVLYIESEKINGNKLNINYSFGDETVVIEGEVTDNKFNEEELLTLETMRTLDESETVFGDQINGISLKVEDKEMEAEGLKFKYSDVIYLEELTDEFRDGIVHLEDSSWTEKLLVVKVGIENIEDVEKHLGKFKLFKGDEDTEGISSLLTVEAEKSNNGVLEKSFMEKYDLLNYRGFGPNLIPLEGNEKTNGNIIFYSNDLELGETYYLSYEGLKEKSLKLEIVMKQ